MVDPSNANISVPAGATETVNGDDDFITVGDKQPYGEWLRRHNRAEHRLCHDRRHGRRVRRAQRVPPGNHPPRRDGSFDRPSSISYTAMRKETPLAPYRIPVRRRRRGERQNSGVIAVSTPLLELEAP